MLEEIIIGVTVGIVLTIFGWMINQYRNQPKIRLEILGKTFSSGRGIDYNCKLKLTNISNYPATDLNILYPNAEYELPLKVSKNITVLANSFTEICFKITVKYDLSDDPGEHKRIEKFMPLRLRMSRFVLSYKNEHGKQFYTLFIKDNDLQRSTFHIFSPKIDKEKLVI